MDYLQLQDKCRGSIVGGAVGDALGYEVEFMDLSEILNRFGEKGITRFVNDAEGIAGFSDDTQMTLFTLEGLMTGLNSNNDGSPESILPYIRQAYLNWYKTQTESPDPLPDSSLWRIKSLWSRRAPGNTCLSALCDISLGRTVRNNSKGCGGVMRVAPIGIFYGAHPDIASPLKTAMLAGLAADLTHKHIASTFASAMLALIVEFCISHLVVGIKELEGVIIYSLEIISEAFPGYDSEFKSFSKLMNLTLELAKSDMTDFEGIRKLGQGWVGDEAIAIALFAVLRHIDSFEDCIVCAVNHDGDSDSTGAIAGNIIGAITGYAAIPEYFTESLEIENELVKRADSLCHEICE
ncbi:MAG: ADP-ribosylglycohydrolase family protein [Muribaculaceae bacterium]|nr:ADP-ribosylglycohydrolase family protein [Muribaculaceae bacterium]